MIAPEAGLSVSRQCALLAIARGSFYYRPRPESAEELELLKRLDRIFTDNPVYGSRRLQVALLREGISVGRRRVRRLMRKLGLWAVRPKRNTSKRHPESTSRTRACPRESGGVGRLHNVHTHAARVFVPGCDHRLGDPTSAVLAAIEHADGGVLCRGAERGPCPVRQARHLQYRSGCAIHQRRVYQVLRDHGIAISMDGRGRCHDNIFVERLWWTVKHEWVYLRPAANGIEQRRSLGEFFDWYNLRRPHQALGWRPRTRRTSAS